VSDPGVDTKSREVEAYWGVARRVRRAAAPTATKRHTTMSRHCRRMTRK
jgi:hypothetical protein